MKIMYIIKAFAMKAGLERVVSDKINYLAEHGYEVSLITYEQGNHPLSFSLHTSVHFYNLDARFFKLSQLPLWKRPIVMWQMRRRFKKGLQQTVDIEQPDIIIATTYSMKILDIILSIQTKAHRLIESHIACYTVRKTYDYRNNLLLHNIAKLYDKWTFRNIGKFEKLIVLTQGDAQDWSQYIKDVVVIPNPLTCYPDGVRPHDGTGHRIICAGRLSEQKGFDLLVEAFSQIAGQCPAWHIDIFGSGEDEQKLHNKIHQHRLDERIKIFPPSSRIYDEYQNSEFFVLSSRYEGFGLVLIEAMACGIPCVSFRCKYGPEEIVTNGINGLLVENGDVRALAESILFMINHSEERLRMGIAAREMTRCFQKDIIMKEWIELFDSKEMNDNE